MAGKLKLNMDDISLGDLEDFEAYTGQSFLILDTLTNEASVKAMDVKVFTGLALLVLRQEDPDATVDDARRVKLADLMAVDDDPTGAEPVELKPLREASPRGTTPRRKATTSA